MLFSRMPNDTLTTLGLALAAVASLAACCAAGKRLCCSTGWESPAERGLTLLSTLLATGVFLYRLLVVHHQWQPLQAHVDGLSLLAAVLGAVILYVQFTDRVRGLDLFTLPVMAVMTTWGVCASRWTLRLYEVDDVWRVIHLVSVYLGTLGVVFGGAAGALYLHVDRLLRQRRGVGRLATLGRFSDLETIERAVVAAAASGFILITIGLVTGLVIVTADPGKLGPGWWHSPKVALAGAVWAIYALVMHVRFVPNFRGRRAAWLAIIGFVLMVGVLGLSSALPPLADSIDQGSRPAPSPAVAQGVA
jgi:ABC-type transport system involved in cytochrome c biogenesis permease subunit